MRPACRITSLVLIIVGVLSAACGNGSVWETDHADPGFRNLESDDGSDPGNRRGETAGGLDSKIRNASAVGGAGSGMRQVPAVGSAHADTAEFRRQRLQLVRLLAARGVEDPRVLDAIRAVPRHRFVPETYVGNAYDNRPLPIGYGQTISQPLIVAYMTELIRPEPSDRVLEVGTGSGYQAAVLAEVVQEVYTVEIVPELARTARLRLQELGYDEVHVKQADGYFGWQEHAPFDAIVVTAAAEHIPPPLIDQLKNGGRMIIPVGSPFRTQMLMLVEKDGEEISTRSLMPVAFVPFTRAQE